MSNLERDKLFKLCVRKYLKGFVDAEKYLDEKREAVKYARSTGPIKHVGEIGVQAGLGAWAIMEASGAKTYTGWDNEAHSGPLPAEEARRILNDSRWSAVIIIADSQELVTLGHKKYGLFHIDGDHHPVACFHDMVLAHKSMCDKGWLLIDDYNSPLVQEAVGYWMYRYKDHVLETKHFEGVTGNFLIRVQAYE